MGPNVNSGFHDHRGGSKKTQSVLHMMDHQASSQKWYSILQPYVFHRQK